MTTTMHRRERLLSKSRVKISRFLKSYKYKHKLEDASQLYSASQISNPSLSHDDSSCDHPYPLICARKHTKSKEKSNNDKQPPVKTRAYSPIISQLLLLLLCYLLAPRVVPTVNAFCPFKCLCDDQSLSANCTRVPSISIIPMTLNPLLKKLTLNQLPMAELSNSLSVYRQLEYLNLNSNQLRQVKYENFNFKPTPPSIVLVQSSPLIPLVPSNFNSNNNGPISSLQQELHQELSANNEQLARHLRLTIDKSLRGIEGDSVGEGDSPRGESSSPVGPSEGAAASSSADDEIRFHLRELDLGDNKIEELGSLSEQLQEESAAFEKRHRSSEQQEGDSNLDSNLGTGSYKTAPDNRKQSRRIKSAELERLAPFLTLTKLEYLNLAGNRLSRLHQHVFLGLLNLKELDLSRNSLEFIDKHAFVGLIELKALKLSKNRLALHLHHLGVSFCRAPMNELRALDLSDNYHHPVASQQRQQPSRFQHQHQHQHLHHYKGSPRQLEQPATGELHFLPNQMFICAPRLVSLRLEALQLRYIQVNAFDNLQALEQLYLGRNQLEQVPKDSLQFSHSNVSQTLRELDLSETHIEFVNAHSFETLQNLQRLSLNSMPRLVSFDLAAFSLRNTQSLAPQSSTRRDQDSQVIRSAYMASSEEFSNDQLQELSLALNPRLQSLHSSLVGPINFSNLKLLNLEGALELREIPLEEMINFSSLKDNQLRLDLSFVSKLNCSACQLNWLVDAARWQQLLSSSTLSLSESSRNNNFNVRNPIGLLTDMETQQSSLGRTKLSFVALDSIGCSWPFAMPLVQLLQLDTTFAPIFRHCTASLGPTGPQDQELAGSRQQQQQRPSDGQQPDRQDEQQSARQDELLSRGRERLAQLGWLASAALLALLLLACAGSLKLALGLLHSRRRGSGGAGGRLSRGFEWSSSGLRARGELAGSDCPVSSPAQSNSSGAVDCSSSSILSTATNGRLVSHLQQQQQQQLVSSLQHFAHLGRCHCREPACPLKSDAEDSKNRSPAERLRRLMKDFKDLPAVARPSASEENWRANLFSRIAGRFRLGSALSAPRSASKSGRTSSYLLAGDPSACFGRIEAASNNRATPSAIFYQQQQQQQQQVAGAGWPGSEIISEPFGAAYQAVAAEKSEISARHSNRDLRATSYYFSSEDPAPEKRQVRTIELDPAEARASRLAGLRKGTLPSRPAANTCQQRQHLEGQFAGEPEADWRGQLGQEQQQQQQVKLSQKSLGLQQQQAKAGSSPSSQVVIDGHIYVTLDGPIKQEQEGGESDEWAKQVYEPPRPPQLQAGPTLGLQHKQGAFRSGSTEKSGRAKKEQSAATGSQEEANCPATLDYKSFEWSASSSSSSSLLDSSASSLERARKLSKCDEEEKFKLASSWSGPEQRALPVSGTLTGISEPAEERPATASSMAGDPSQLERQLAKQLSKLSFQIEGKNRQRDSRSFAQTNKNNNNNNNNNNNDNNKGYNSNASASSTGSGPGKSAVHSEVHLRDNIADCRFLPADSSKNNEGPSVPLGQPAFSGAERGGGGVRRPMEGVEMWKPEKNWPPSLKSDLGKEQNKESSSSDHHFGSSPESGQLCAERKQLLAGRPLCTQTDRGGGGNVTGHIDYQERCEARCSLASSELKKKDDGTAEKEAGQLFMSPNGRSKEEEQEVAARGIVSGRPRAAPNSGQLPAGSSDLQRAQLASSANFTTDANHGYTTGQLEKRQQHTGRVTPNHAAQINNHYDYVINGLQRPSFTTASSSSDSPGQQQLVGGKLMGVSQQQPANLDACEKDRQQTKRLKEYPAPEMIMIGQRNFPAQTWALDNSVASSSSNSSSNSNSSLSAQQAAGRSTSNRKRKPPSSLEERAIERESCDYSAAKQEEEFYFCDISTATTTLTRAEQQSQQQPARVAANRSKLISDSNNRTDSQPAAHPATNEIYSNQFYYYSPSKPPSNRQQDHSR